MSASSSKLRSVCTPNTRSTSGNKPPDITIAANSDHRPKRIASGNTAS